MDCRFKSHCKKILNGKCNMDDFCMRRYKLDFLFDNSLIPKNRIDKESLFVDEDGTDIDIFERLQNIQSSISDFVKNGGNLYLCSNSPGNGKTSWAIRLAQYFIYCNWIEFSLKPKVLFISVPKFLLELKANIGHESSYIAFINENINDVDLVIWDDIATKSATEFEHEHLLSLIDSRIYDGKSNIFTSNVLPDNLSELLGGRLASRIVNESECLEFNGKDKRGVNR